MESAMAAVEARREEFRRRLAEVLDLDAPPAPDWRFRETPGWCSLMAFGILMTLEGGFGVRLAAADLERCLTVGDLESWIGSAA